ncbi:MAG: 1-deoxy-D-xylulose-5-phosphate reductoisomerase [Magnetococcales bacterium]|nr:1-deoxy-D-xylulose-5-phosphate reductoisomerase [Magnetococcales bacterium]
MDVKNIAILGSTGSIGTNTLEVVAANPDRFRVVALAGGHNVHRLVEQTRRFHPEAVAVADAEAAAWLARELADEPVRVLSGPQGVSTAATWESASLVMSAIVGGAGLPPTLAAVRAGKDIALANKECLVMAGPLFMDEVARHGVRLIPVDSEHSAIFQVFSQKNAIRRLILTASGGPFLGWKRTQLTAITPEQALAHPKWNMGRKISIDSATLMNKGLEVIEAHWLFGVPTERIEVVVHPDSIVHSLVEYVDGSILAQMGVPDMRTPIAVALAFPERVPVPVPSLDLVTQGRLLFHPTPAREDFPCLGLAYDALNMGGAAPTVLNAANEVAVAAFLEGALPFLGIARVIEQALESLGGGGLHSLQEVMEMDAMTRIKARESVEPLSSRAVHAC